MISRVTYRLQTSARFLVGVLVVLSFNFSVPTGVSADALRAAELFRSGNEHFARAQRLRGGRRHSELEAALTAYLESLAEVRSRNTLFNVAVTLEQLGRHPEAYNLWTEYLASPGLSEDERRDGLARQNALTEMVARLRVVTDSDSTIWVDRRDLPSVGVTEATLAVSAGRHTILIEGPRRVSVSRTVEVGLGQLQTVEIQTERLPTRLVVRAGTTAVLLDGRRLSGSEVTNGLMVPPGAHRLEVVSETGTALVRDIDVPPQEEFEITLEPDVSQPAAEIHLAQRDGDALNLRLDGTTLLMSGDSLTLDGGRLEVDLMRGGQRYQGSSEIDPGERYTLLPQEVSNGIGDWRWAMTAILAADLLYAGTFAVISTVDLSSYQRNSPNAQEHFNRIEQWNLMADIGWGAAIGLGTVALVLWLIPDSDHRIQFRRGLVEISMEASP